MKIVVLVSAGAEWRAVKELLPPAKIDASPFGESFMAPLASAPELGPLTFFHGGWGKISAAATAQYTLDHCAPELLVNLGTCGGFAGRIERGTIILVERTIVYDILEQMSDPEAATAHYETELDLSWIQTTDRLAGDSSKLSVRRGLMVSADRDLLPTDIPLLIEKYNAVAADWESGAIAWVAQRNGTRCLILRGVTDLVGGEGGEAYGDYALFEGRTRGVMESLLELFPNILQQII